MKPWRRTAATVVTASAVLLTGQTAGAVPPPAPASQAARQGFRAAAQLAADDYRQQRRQILLGYRDATRAAHRRLRQALLDATSQQERAEAWQVYTRETEPLRAAAHRDMQHARAAFREAVETARAQFGVDAAPNTYARVR